MKSTKRIKDKTLCRCSCGTELEVSVQNVVSGLSKACRSCGSRKAKTKHGASDCGRRKKEDRLYRIWKAMKWRCSKNNARNRAGYADREICVCLRWRFSYEAFRDWSMENGYRDDLTIDSTDNDKGYEPGNCQWATSSEQSRNTRRNRILTAFGETKTMVEWGQDPRCTVNGNAFRRRISRGWSTEAALLTHHRLAA